MFPFKVANNDGDYHRYVCLGKEMNGSWFDNAQHSVVSSQNFRVTK